MSKPINPLSKFNSYTIRHVLLAFDNTDAACSFKVPATGIGDVGSEVKGVQSGKAIVVVNELEDSSYAIKDVIWSYDFFSPLNINTTICGGNLVIVDMRGNQFPLFLRRIAKQLKRATTKITFHLTTFFNGINPTTGETESVSTKPLIFHITDSSTGFHRSISNLFNLNFVLLYNTLAQLPQYSQLTQFTITNSENSPAKSLPVAAGATDKILSRKEEDRIKSKERQNRLNKSRPMRNLRELFLGLEAELKEMRYEHKAQLQEFMSIIRPSHVKVIKPPKPQRVKVGEGLPIDYSVKLDRNYEQYPVNNRNLLTEQVELKKDSVGIHSLTVPPGSDLYSAVDTLMKTSSNVGGDVRDGFGYKMVVTSRFTTDGLLKNTLLIKRYKIPRNKEGVIDTGNEAESKKNTFELTYLDGEGSSDIMSLSIASSVNSDISILEEDSDNIKDDPVAYSSLREQLTFERADTEDFMKNGFHGFRTLVNPINIGSQDARSTTLVDSLKYYYTITQGTFAEATIAGNPDLYSDLARNPRMVEDEKEDDAKIFKFPEYYPLYLKMQIKVGKSRSEAHKPGDAEENWYHTYHYHVSGVTNIISGGMFLQKIRLLYSDDSI